MRSGDAALPSFSAIAQAAMKKCSIRAVARGRGRRATAPARPSPKVPLTASLASAPPVSGNPPRLSASSPGHDQRRRPAPPAERSDDADGQKQGGLHQHMVRGIEGDVRRRAPIAAGEAHAQRRAAITPIWLMLE